MRNVCQQDECLLCGKTLLASSLHLQPTLIGLDFGFTGAPIIVVGNRLGHRPTGYGVDYHGMLDLVTWRTPTQHQTLARPGIRGRVDSLCDPTLFAQRQPVSGCHSLCPRLWASTALVLCQNLPLCIERIVHVGIAAKTGV